MGEQFSPNGMSIACKVASGKISRRISGRVPQSAFAACWSSSDTLSQYGEWPAIQTRGARPFRSAARR